MNSYCIYTIQHSFEFIRKREGHDRFDYNVSDPNIWKYPSGICGNPNCPYKHNREEFIEQIQENPREFLLTVMEQCIKRPETNLPAKIYNPFRKLKFDEAHKSICMCHDYCNCPMRQRYGHNVINESIKYLNCNTWYAFNSLTDIIWHILNHDGKSAAWSLTKVFWKFYSLIKGKNIGDIRGGNYCIYALIDKERHCDCNALCKNKSHDVNKWINEMSNSVSYWAQSIINCIRQCIKNRIDTSILPIPFDDKDTYMKCDEFIKQYTKTFKQALGNPTKFKDLINLSFTFEGVD